MSKASGKSGGASPNHGYCNRAGGGGKGDNGGAGWPSRTGNRSGGGWAKASSKRK